MKELWTTKYGVHFKDYVHTESHYIAFFKTKKEAENYIKEEEKRINAGCSWLEVHEYACFPRKDIGV